MPYRPFLLSWFKTVPGFNYEKRPPATHRATIALSRFHDYIFMCYACIQYVWLVLFESVSDPFPPLHWRVQWIIRGGIDTQDP